MNGVNSLAFFSAVYLGVFMPMLFDMIHTGIFIHSLIVKVPLVLNKKEYATAFILWSIYGTGISFSMWNSLLVITVVRIGTMLGNCVLLKI